MPVATAIGTFSFIPLRGIAPMNSLSPSATRPAGFQQAWRLAAMALVAVRFVQGWIYWGGGSRRFIYAPSKLDPHAAHWMAYKFQTAMPGAILGMNHVVSWLLLHFSWLYAGVIGFSLVELVAGLMLIAGVLTRLAAAASMGLAFVLMLLFGWQGATCIDEWTMAACNFGMGVTLLLAGGGAWSVDSYLARRYPSLADKRWFQWLGGVAPVPLSDKGLKTLSGVLLGACVLFVVGTYDYYRGSVVSAFHSGPVSPTAHRWALSNAELDHDGCIRFAAYIDAGTPEAASYVVQATLARPDGTVVERWGAATLAGIAPAAISNVYAYQKIHVGPYGLVGPIGAKAEITLPVSTAVQDLDAGRYVLRLTSVNGRHWSLKTDLQ